MSILPVSASIATLDNAGFSISRRGSTRTGSSFPYQVNSSLFAIACYLLRRQFHDFIYLAFQDTAYLFHGLKGNVDAIPQPSGSICTVACLPLQVGYGPIFINQHMQQLLITNSPLIFQFFSIIKNSGKNSRVRPSLRMASEAEKLHSRLARAFIAEEQRPS